jgi:nucleotide-binding universal stress UspA family protein
MSADPESPAIGPVLIAYDGSALAAYGIEEAARLLGTPGDAVVVCVWEQFDVGFLTPNGVQFNAEQATQVRAAAEETAAHGAELAEAAGFKATSRAIEGTPTWKGIVDLSEEIDSRLVVLGSHGHSGLGSLLVGSVAAAVTGHSRRTVLIAHARD